MDTEEVFRSLDTSPQGLTGEKVEERKKKYGLNKIEEEQKIGVLHILLEQFQDPLIYILLVAGVITTALGELIDTYVILAVVLLNAVIGFTQEFKAEKAISALAQLASPRARVLRQGNTSEIETEELVPGDVVLLTSGSRVPADLRLFETTLLEINESTLTGESLGVRKKTKKLEDESSSLTDRTNLAYMGTIVLSGRGKGVVVKTGRETEIGKISETVKDIKQAPTPLQVQFIRMGKIIGGVIVGLSVLTFFLGIIIGLPPSQILLTAIALAVAAIPEGLPIVFTLTLAIGVSRMAKRGAIMRRLPAVETLGSCSIIASDKTGTLTKNEMTVLSIFAGDTLYDVTGTGFEPHGEITLPGTKEKEDLESNSALELCLRAGFLANESGLNYSKEKGYTAEGDPTETALIVSALKGGINRNEEGTKFQKLHEIPFESEKLYMATLNRSQEGEHYIFVKGAPEKVLEMTAPTALYRDGKPGTLDKKKILEQYEQMGREGLRVLAMAYKKVSPSLTELSSSDVEKDLLFLGLQGMIDPPREEALEAIRQSKKAGIRIIMVTGDHQITAEAIARKLDIIPEGETAVLTGKEIDRMDDDELYERVGQVSIYARVSPLNKLQIVQQLIRQGEIVAVTGDGVNDAPALKAAHIGVAMGKTGTDVAKETSDMIITDDNFASIFSAVAEGRVVFSNLRKVVFFLLGTGAGMILLILFIVLTGFPLPFLPAQILWVNLVTNGLQDMALAFEPPEEGVIQQLPRRREEPIISSLILERLVLVGLVIMLGTFLTYLWQLNIGAPLAQARTVALTTMVFFQLFHVFNSRSELTSMFKMNPLSNPFLFYSTIASLSAHLLVIYWPPLQFVFRTVPLLPIHWLAAALAASTIIIIIEIEKAFRRKSMESQALLLRQFPTRFRLAAILNLFKKIK
ncbi:HAD-IC family P-type ATPase [Candidatus Contubernalis alkalaceticus]|nr:HAD-IC family P-type ATPase [Candidatus Contubernalis alkalaceticus]